MEKLYAVHDGEEYFAIVKGDSKEGAFESFVESKIEDRYIQEHITEFIVNSSLLEEFYRDEEGSFFDNFTGDVVDRLSHMNDEEQLEYINSCIEKNVREFWDDKHEFAEEYLRELKKSQESTEPYSGDFSIEFIIDTAKRLILNTDWMNINIVELDLSDKNIQVISE